MQENGKSDFCPLSADFDRYLFLEALHSAQDYLLLSYCGFSQQDNKELNPSLVVEELFSYSDSYYTIEGSKISEKCSIQASIGRLRSQLFYFRDKPQQLFPPGFSCRANCLQIRKVGSSSFCQSIGLPQHPG